jgi:hypothetical protein
MNAEKRIGLAELIGDLRKELIKAQREGSDDEIRFLLEEVEVEVEVTSAKKATGEAGVEFWVVNTKAGGEIATESVQTLKLKLKPQKGDGGSQQTSGQAQVLINTPSVRPND